MFLFGFFFATYVKSKWWRVLIPTMQHCCTKMYSQVSPLKCINAPTKNYQAKKKFQFWHHFGFGTPTLKQVHRDSKLFALFPQYCCQCIIYIAGLCRHCCVQNCMFKYTSAEPDGAHFVPTDWHRQPSLCTKTLPVLQLIGMLFHHAAHVCWHPVTCALL